MGNPSDSPGRSGSSPSRRRLWIAHAHSGDQAYVYLVLNGSELIGSVQMPLRDLEKVLGETLFEGAPDHSPLDERLVPAVSDYVRRHYSIRCGDEHLELVFGEATFRDLASGPYLFADYSAPRPVERPCRLEVSYDAIIESMPGREAIVFALISRGWAGLYRHEETRLEFDGDHQTRSIDLLVPSMSENARASLGRAAKLLRGKAKGAARRIRAIAR